MKYLFFISLTFSFLLKMEALEYQMLPGITLRDHNPPICISTKSLDDFVEKGLSSLCIITDEEPTHLNDRLIRWLYGSGGGTGFFITDEGHLITCKRVINSVKSPIVFLGLTGQFIKTSIVAVHPTENLAILKIDKPHNIDLSYLRISFTPGEIGDWVFSLRGRAVINDSRLFVLPSMGKVMGCTEDGLSYICLSMTGTGENFGSPVFNLEGKVIGILASSTTISDNVKIELGALGALPTHRVKDWIEDTLRSDGYFETLE